MFSITTNVDYKGLEHFLRRFRDIPNRITSDLKRLGLAALREMKPHVPISRIPHSHLRNSFRVKVTRSRYNWFLSIYSNKPYAAIADVPSRTPSRGRIPTRYPVRAHAMVFRIRGKLIFAKRAKWFRRKGAHYSKYARDFISREIFNYVNWDKYMGLG